MKFQKLHFFVLSLAILFLFNQCSYLVYDSKPSTSSNTTASTGNSALRKDVVELAEDQIGTKYTYGGESPRSGFDCSGLTSYVLNAHNVSLPHQSAAQEGEGRKIDVDQVEPGDLIFFRRSKGGKVFHVALVVQHDSDGIVVVHSTSSRGVIRENITKSSYWAPKISTARLVLK